MECVPSQALSRRRRGRANTCWAGARPCAGQGGGDAVVTVPDGLEQVREDALVYSLFKPASLPVREDDSSMMMDFYTPRQIPAPGRQR